MLERDVSDEELHEIVQPSVGGFYVQLFMTEPMTLNHEGARRLISRLESTLLELKCAACGHPKRRHFGLDGLERHVCNVEHNGGWCGCEFQGHR